MADALSAPEVTIWTDASRAAWVGPVLDLMGDAVHPISVGGPRTAEAADLGRRLNCPGGDDLRKLLIERPAAFVFLATMDGVSPEDIATALAQESTILTLEPLAASFDELAPLRLRAGGETGGAAGVLPLSAGRIVSIPAFAQSPGWTSAANPLEVLGSVRLVGLTSFGTPAECSLFARLYDAFRVVRTLAAMPETIDASLIGPLSTEPENPRAITGHLAAHVRLPDAAAAVLQISDLAGAPQRQLTIVGDHGRVRAGDLDYELLDAGGKLLDHHAPQTSVSSFADLVVWQWTRLLQRTGAAAAPEIQVDDAEILACCLAALLSSRTGQPESPAKLLALQRKT